MIHWAGIQTPKWVTYPAREFDLIAMLGTLNPNDPVLYDFALFGLGIEGFAKEDFLIWKQKIFDITLSPFQGSDGCSPYRQLQYFHPYGIVSKNQEYIRIENQIPEQSRLGNNLENKPEGLKLL